MSPGIAPLWRRQFANKLGFRTVAIAQGASSRKLAAFTPTGGGDASPGLGRQQSRSIDRQA